MTCPYLRAANVFSPRRAPRCSEEQWQVLPERPMCVNDRFVLASSHGPDARASPAAELLGLPSEMADRATGQ